MNINNTFIFSGDAGGAAAAAGWQGATGAGLQGTAKAVTAGYAGSLFQQLIVQMLAAKGSAAEAAAGTAGSGVQDMSDEDGGLLAGMLLTEDDLSGISLLYAGTGVNDPGDSGGLTGESNPAAESGSPAVLSGGQLDGMQAFMMAMTGSVPVKGGSFPAFGPQGKPGAEVAAASAGAAAAGGNDAGIPASLKALFMSDSQTAAPVEAGVQQEGASAQQTGEQLVGQALDGSATAFMAPGSDGKSASIPTGLDPAGTSNPAQTELNAKGRISVSGPEIRMAEYGSGAQAADMGSKTPEAAEGKSGKTAGETATDAGRISQEYQHLNSAVPAVDTTGQNISTPSAEKAEPYSQIRDEILAKLEQKGPAEFKMQLEPEELGQIDIKLKLSEGKLIIDILAASSRTQALLTSQVDKLIAGMGLQNVQVESIQVGQQANSQGQDSGQDQGYQANAGMDFSQRKQQEQLQDESSKNGNLTAAFGLPQKDVQENSPANRIEAFRYGSHRMNYTV